MSAPLVLSILDQSVALAGRPQGEAIREDHRTRPPLRDIRLRPLLGLRASQQRHHRRHRPEILLGGHRRHYEPHPHRQRRHHAAPLCAAEGG